MGNDIKSLNFRKDASLDELADLINVAQFVSFSPLGEITQEYSRVLGYEQNFKFDSITTALSTLLSGSVDLSVNIRSFLPNDPRSHEFIYGLKDLEKIEDAVRRLARAGFYVIANETIDINDGGVSGVIQGGVIEFSPDDTPRCVEKPGLVSVPVKWGISMLRAVYGFTENLEMAEQYRLEFSVHPRPCGWKHTHVLGWELEDVGPLEIMPEIGWPNNFSRLIGDKAFGLLIANEAGLPVPRTTVISRRVAPFSFGSDTGSVERWIRTCPKEQAPGKFTTHHGWLDPFALLAKEDPTGKDISSVLAQYAVRAEYSGALIVDVDGVPIIEGMRGEGEALMLGIANPEVLPQQIITDVLALYANAYKDLGPVRFEWVHDGSIAWIVQLHRGATTSSARIIVPGEAINWHIFEVSRGLSELRSFLELLHQSDGLILRGNVGLTSHIADVLRKSKIPARVE